MKFPKIGVIIVTYNSETYIERCLKSIINGNYKNFEIIVVDNLSNDGTLSIINKNFKQIRIVKNSKNLGFASANNIGIKYLLKKKCEYLLLLNPDTVSSTNLIKKLTNVFENDSKIGIAGCIITYAKNQKKIWFAGGYFNKLFCFTRHKFMNKSLGNVDIKSGKTDFITGACMMIKKDAIEKCGFIPEDYFLYFEDVFFCQKIKEKKFFSYLLAEPLVSHYVSTSAGVKETNKMSPLRAYFFARNPILYIKKNVKGYLNLTSYFGQFFVRLPFYILKITRDKNLKSAKSYFLGIYDGLFWNSFKSSPKNDL